MNKINIFYKYSIQFTFALVLIAYFGSLFLNFKFSDFTFSLFVPILFLILGIKFYEHNKFKTNRIFIIKLIALTFFIKLISIVVFTEILIHYIGVPFLSFKDDYNYYHSSVNIARSWKTNGLFVSDQIQFSTGFYSGYPNINALAIYLFGESEYVLRILNSIASSLILLVCFKILRFYTSIKVSRLVLTLIGFSPLLIYFSSFILKDIMLLLFTLITVYSICSILNNKISLKVIFLLLFSLVLMIFFRAATIIPILSAFFVVYISRFFLLKKEFSYSSILIILASFIVFVNFWDYLSSFDIVTDSESYYSPRIDSFSGKEVENTGTNISKLGFIEYLGAPVFLLVSLFLPSFLFVDLDSAESINYSSSALIYHYSILPFILVSFFFILKKYKTINSSILFICLVILLFKVGLALSINSLFSARQSLGSIYLMYLILPVFFDQKVKTDKLKFYFIISVLIIIVYNILRLIIRL